MSKTLVLYVLDMSGSMQPIRDVTVNQFNEMLAGLKGEDCYIRLVKFDSAAIEVVTEGVPLEGFTLKDYEPRASTPLYDAIGESVLKADDWLKAEAAAGRTYKVICVVHTDGQENASRAYTLAKVKALIGEKKATGFWEFIYLGVGQDAWIDSVATMDMSGQSHTPHTPVGAMAAAAYSTDTVRTYARTGKVK